MSHSNNVLLFPQKLMNSRHLLLKIQEEMEERRHMSTKKYVGDMLDIWTCPDCHVMKWEQLLNEWTMLLDGEHYGYVGY